MKVGDLVQLKKEFCFNGKTYRRNGEVYFPGGVGLVVGLEKEFYKGQIPTQARVTVKWISGLVAYEPEAALTRFPE